MKRISLLATVTLMAVCAFGQIRLPHLVSDGMVLQRDAPLKIWGWASPDEAVQLSFDRKSYRAVAGKDGSWEIALPPQKAGGPYAMTLKAANTITLQNILIGDVWICSGQSNMETPISRVMAMFGEEIARYANPKIRYVKIPLSYSFHAPQADVLPCSWVELNPETAGNFSAVAYFFAKELIETTNVPIGLINSSVGGSPAEAWVSEAALQDFPALLNDKRICESDEYVSAMLRLGALPGQRWNEVLNEQDKGLNEGARWYSPGYSDAAWQTTDLFDNSWGRNGFRPVNGVFWFRKTVEVPAEWENQPVKLHMGRIVNSDSVYVNGAFAGATAYQYPPRSYTIPANVLRAGKNEIAVRLVCPAGFPEFVKDKPYKMAFNGQEVSLEGEWKYRAGAVMPAAAGGGVTFQYKPVGLYNAMIAPLQNFSAKGFLWYQGESNTDRYRDYGKLMTALISDWRSLWRQDLPFLIVQLANFMEPSPFQPNSGWAELRDVQLQLSQAVPNTALAVAIDVGEWNDIHPLNKKDVGKRLSLAARKLAYGESKLVYSGPIYKSMKTEGNKIILTFDHTGSGLTAKGDRLNTFVVAGADRRFVPANAKIESNTVAVWSDEVKNPVMVRYAWANNPENANLYNKEGLPASPFRTE